MKLILTIISAISILILSGPYSAFSQSDRIDNLATNYGIYIDGYISKLESKTDMLRNTKSENLREQTVIYCLKLDFLKTHKKELANTMMASNVGVKPYKIKYFLDGIFFNEVKTKQKIAALYNCSECGRSINLTAFGS